MDEQSASGGELTPGLSPSGRVRQERAAHTYRALVRVAAEVFAEDGYTRASISRICELAGVTKGALYFHFPAKDDLADAVLDAYRRSLERLTAETRAAAETVGASPMSGLIGLSYELAHRLQEDPLTRAAARLGVRGSAGRHWSAEFSRGWSALAEWLVRSADRRGELRAGVVPEAVAGTVLAVSGGVGLLVPPGRQAREQQLAGSWRLLLPGLVADDALVRFGWVAAGGSASDQRA